MVYLALDTTLDRDVAFALIKTDGLDETSRIRIQREAQAMGRLGSHAHIVTVFDLGEENGQPYMVTELMGGVDVEGIIEDAEDHRLPREQEIKIAQETCRGMAFTHSRGIVHRDLKPGNVWITSDGIAKIGDFGLAVALDRSRLHRNTQKNAVNCYYILGKNTIDNFIWNLIEKNRKVAGAILGGLEGDLGSALLDDVIDYLVSKK